MISHKAIAVNIEKSPIKIVAHNCVVLTLTQTDRDIQE